MIGVLHQNFVKRFSVAMASEILLEITTGVVNAKTVLILATPRQISSSVKSYDVVVQKSQKGSCQNNAEDVAGDEINLQFRRINANRKPMRRHVIRRFQTSK